MEKKQLNYFRIIINFVNELGALYEINNKPLKLYRHLLSRTTFSDKKPISKHVDSFKKFCKDNKDNILEKKTPFDSPIILYSSKVYLDMNSIMKLANDNEDSIWSYMITFLAMTDPSSGAKKLLKSHKQTISDVNSKNFIDDIVKKVETSVDPNSNNPIQTFGSIMASGLIPEIMGNLNGGMENGSLNLAGLVGTLEGMLSNIQEQVGDSPECKQALTMAAGLMKSLKDQSSTSECKIEEVTDEPSKNDID